MRRVLIFSLLLPGAVVIALAAFTVGGGAPSAAVQASFQFAFNRGQFSQLTTAPLSNVQALGTPGLIQTFQWAANTSLTAALVDSDPVNTNKTLQVYADIYALWLNAGVSSAGYPINDTTVCPPNSYGVCNYQVFSKDYVFFAYSTPSAVNYSVADPVYTEWNSIGGIGGNLGAAISAAAPVTSEASTAGTQQLFAGGAIYSYSPSSGVTSTLTVAGTVYSAFTGAGGIAAMGFPATEETVLTSGQHQQIFENGRVLWSPGNAAIVLFPIGAIQINNVSSGFTLSAGGNATLIATVIDTRGNTVTGRALSWSTSNGNAVSVQGNGYSATIKAVGAGSASIQVTGEGKTSSPVVVTVAGQCCAIGEGAPSQSISQAFQAAAGRNGLSVFLPNPTPVSQSGGGYIQSFAAADGSGTIFVIAQFSRSAVAFVIGGALYTAYLKNGGFSGPLGYPASDASAGGTQAFANGAALAGSPVRLVPAPIAARWIAGGAETGPLGPPAGDSAVFISVSGINGNVQSFSTGAIYGITSGSRSGQAYISSGMILQRYLALSGPAGQLGTPLSDVVTSGGALRQNFETGYIDLQPDAAAVEHYNPLNPSVTTVPATVTPGGKVHISITGFGFGAGLTVSVTGQNTFNVTVPGGEFGWDIVVPTNAKAATVTIRATAAPSQTASGSYTIAPVAALRPSLTIVSGDQQNGAPGATLGAPLIAVLADLNGNPLAGVPVSYSVSPGASAIVPAVTGADGTISAALRLQPSAGVALLSVSAGAQTVTFSALAGPKTITGFPTFTQTGPQAGLTAALAGVINYRQNTGALSGAHGAATPASLNQYLAVNGGFTVSETGAAVANPWVAMKFAGIAGGISIEPPDLPHVLDVINAGSPLILELNLLVDGAPGGSAAVDAIGINADASIAIVDPNPAFARSSLSDYLNGFSAQGHSIQGSLSGVIHIVPALTNPAGFVSVAIASSAQSADSSSGACSNSIVIGDPAIAGQSAPAKVGAVGFFECDGAQPSYQLGFGTAAGAVVIDLAGGPTSQIPAGSAPAWQVTRVNGTLTIAPQPLVITSVVNAAGFGSGLSPGEIVSIFGAGFTAGPVAPTLTINGQPARVLAAFPFQVNAIIPAGTAPGTATLSVNGPAGTAGQSVTLLVAAPGIFAIANADGTVNSPSNPAQRGAYLSIYGTGLGASSSPTPAVALGSILVKPSYAGQAPGFPGLFQINVQIPFTATPGSGIPVSVTQIGQTSNAVSIAIE